jgi:methyl-accepting chemotaxis protein
MRHFLSGTVSARITVIPVLAGLVLVSVTALGILQLRSQLLASREEALRSHVEIAHSVIDTFVQRSLDGEISTDEAQEDAREAVRALSYDGDGYFFVLAPDDTAVVASDSSLEGVEFGSEDPGPLIHDLNAEATDGSGYHRYEYPRPGEEDPAPKLSYVEQVPEWGWVVGTGVYIDDLDAAFLSDAKRYGSIAGLASLLLVGVTWTIVRRLQRALEQRTRGLEAAATHLTRIGDALTSNSSATRGQAEQVEEAASLIAGNATEAAAATRALAGSVDEIAHSSSNASDSTSRAVTAVSLASETVAGLAGSSDEIGAVVNVITSIAKQTNLLALNATIEAARAGHAGKGFAVVATEVKELAQQTAQATGEISSRVAAIQAATTEVTTAIESIAEVISGIDDSNRYVASRAGEQASSTSQIGASVTEVASGSESITGRISEVVELARTTSDAASEAQVAAADLVEITDSIRQLVKAQPGGNDGPAARAALRPAG